MSQDTRDLQGRFALITGAGTGIGAVTASLLASHGAHVFLHYRSSADAAEKLLDDIRSQGGEGTLVQADITDEASILGMFKQIEAVSDRLSVLFNNAGFPIARSSIEECSLELWNEIISTNLTGNFLVSRSAIPLLRKGEKAAIINNISLSVQTGGKNAGPYAIAKGGLQVMTRTLAKELAPDVRVNSIMPGVIETPHHEKFTDHEQMKKYAGESLLGRNGTAEEVANAVYFLASDQSSFINGSLIDISGGRFLR